jgi:hypothetical protein
MTPSKWSRLAVPLAVAALVGCSTPQYSYRDAEMDFGSIQRIAVMPLANLSRETTAPDRVRDVLSSALLATGAVYVVPPGEVARAIARAGILTPATPSVDEVVKLGQAIKAEALITGVVKEYGEVRSGTAVSNVISLSLQLHETTSGKVVWSSTTTKGGISVADRLLGSGGDPMNDVTEEAVDELLDEMLQ